MKIKYLALGSLMLVGSVGALAQEPSKEPVKAPESIEALQKRIAELIEQPRYNAAMWGVKIASLDSGKVLFEHNAQKLFTPASNSKLYTMALALDRLGPDFHIKTSLYAQGRPDASGVLKGDLIVYGRGDPTISGEYNGGDVLKALEPLVNALSSAGVKQIAGDLVGDDSYFHGPPFGSGWDWGDLENEYGAEISALTINSNTMQVVIKPGDTLGAPAQISLSPATDYLKVINRTQTIAKGKPHAVRLYRPVAENVVYVSGDVPLESPADSEDMTMHDPAAWFVLLFKDALARQGITVIGNTRAVHWVDREAQPLDLTQWQEIGSVESRPFREIIRSVEKPSQNLYTDMLLAQVGARANTNSESRTESLGVRELNKFLNRAGLERNQFYFEEGSGLSRDNLVSPAATVGLLTYMSRQKDFDLYYNALPIAGVDGTLRRRMKGTAAAGNVHAKTGTLRWANSMSGYMTNAAGEHLVFSMMLNRYQNMDPERSKTADMDAIAELLANFAVRTEK